MEQPTYPVVSRVVVGALSGALALSALACGDKYHVAQGGGSAVLAGQDAAVCSDTRPAILSAHTLQLWPPNHKFHQVAVSDCVSAIDACNAELEGEFIWGSSDEPVDDIGDGHHAPDILFDDCQHVSLRSERQGPKDGRVYKLGVRFTDRDGNVQESECQVIVDHDQRGVQGADSSEAYRIVLDGSAGQLLCGDTVGDEDAGTGVAGDGAAGTGAAGGGAAGTGAAGTGAAGSGSAGTGDDAPVDAGGPI